MKQKYLVVTKRLSYVFEAANKKEVKIAIAKLNKIGYKKPIVYQCIKG